MSVTSEGDPFETRWGDLHRRVLEWYPGARRDLPWRAPGTTPWGVFVSEIMAQQTPVARVAPVWSVWLARWPTPGDLAAESPGEVVRAWGRLGYPRRALRLREAAVAMVREHGGTVPRDHAALISLPGVGEYTAAAVASFAFGDPYPVVDTNVRRVLARAVSGAAQAAPALTASERALAATSMPSQSAAANTWNVALMELGALVCTARSPDCPRCPVQPVCRWVQTGSPPAVGPRRSGQAWQGTDRQARGALMALLRDSTEPVTLEDLAVAWSDPTQRMRALDTLVADGLVEPLAHDHYGLPR